jgi:hypothetical protein
LWTWLQSYRGRRTYAYSAWDDPGPILNSVGRIFQAGVNRLQRLLKRGGDSEAVRVEKSRPRAMDEVLLAADPTVGRGIRKVSVD